MRSKIHKIRFQIAVVDEDAEGDPVNEIWLDLKEWVGKKNFQSGLPQYLEEVDQQIAQRNQAFADLEAGNLDLTEAEPEESEETS